MLSDVEMAGVFGCIVVTVPNEGRFIVVVKKGVRDGDPLVPMLVFLDLE